MKLAILGILLLIVGCGNPAYNFGAAHNIEVGKIYHMNPNEIPIRREKDEKGGEILFLKERGCAYRIFLNKNQIVTGWDYLSNTKVDWSAPW